MRWFVFAWSVACASGAVAGDDAGDGVAARVARVERQLAAIVGQEASTLRVRYADGLRMTRSDGAVEVRIGGRIHYDVAAIDADDDIEAAVGAIPRVATEFRRARLTLRGRLEHGPVFRMQVDFAGGVARFKNLWVESLPVAGIVARVGFFREPLGLESMTSANHITFLERSLAHALTPGRSTGAMVRGTLGGGLRAFAGAFIHTDAFGNASSGDGYDLTGRLALVLWGEDRGTRLAQIGAGYSFRHYSSADARVRARPEAHLAPFLVDTGAFSVNRADVVAADLAIVHGPWSLQAETVHQFLHRDADDGRFHAWYVLGSVFLTGESRVYRVGPAAFGRVRPASDLTPDPGGRWGSGAVEFALRVSSIDLDAGSIRGGRMTDTTAGVNWYLNPAARVSVNAIVGRRDGLGTIAIAQVRFAIHF